MRRRSVMLETKGSELENGEWRASGDFCADL